MTLSNFEGLLLILAGAIWAFLTDALTPKLLEAGFLPWLAPLEAGAVSALVIGTAAMLLIAADWALTVLARYYVAKVMEKDS